MDQPWARLQSPSLAAFFMSAVVLYSGRFEMAGSVPFRLQACAREFSSLKGSHFQKPAGVCIYISVDSQADEQLQDTGEGLYFARASGL